MAKWQSYLARYKVSPPPHRREYRGIADLDIRAAEKVVAVVFPARVVGSQAVQTGDVLAALLIQRRLVRR